MNRKYAVFSRQSYSYLLMNMPGVVDEVMVGPYEDDGSSRFEFAFRFHKFKQTGNTIHCRLEMYDEAFIAFDEYRDLFDKLKNIEVLTLETLESILVECGFEEHIKGRVAEAG